MNESLRPLTLGEILDRTAQLYRRNFLLFAGAAALPIGVMIAIGVLAALASGRARFWTYLWFLMLQGLVVAGIPLAAAGGVAGILFYLVTLTGGGVAAGVASGFFVFVAFGAALVVIVWLALGYSLGMAVCVVEQKTAWESLMRAWNLSHGTRGRIFVMFLLVVALTMVVSMISYIPFLIIVGVITAAGHSAQTASVAMVVAELVNVIVNFTLQTLLTPVAWIALVLFYYDQRVRKEGFDIEWMMQQAGLLHLQAVSGAAPSQLESGRAGFASAAPASEAGTISGPTLPPDTVEER